ncbi:hypothetical protein ACFFUB_00960 [Algimonas porphyrae]|uniref:TPM domain-containing protein n=2 Tax=Algimonas porphyrae TaxID=1128113 RepID=A0ABQ5V0B2_9PROT|nr:hypothetical protein [Algimonas porphyrae]GLQ20604.1 hypothetical protein GCM10007854_15590 [Algimonas porphyrae]
MMTRLIQVLIAMVLAPLVTACVSDDLVRQTPFTAEQIRAQQVAIDRLIDGDVDGLIALSSDEFQALENVEDTMVKIMTIANAHPISPVIITGEHRVNDTTSDAYPLQYGVWESAYGDGYLIIELVTEANPDCCKLRHVNLTTLDESPVGRHDWASSDTGPVRLLILGLAVLIPAFCLVTAIVCVRDKAIRRKWLWVPFILIGLWGVQLNWTTGALRPNFFSYADGSVTFSFIKFQLLGAGVTRGGPFMPWIIDLGTPVGAILYWAMRRRLKRASNKPGQENAPPDLVSEEADRV